jgi:hypothetical protein
MSACKATRRDWNIAVSMRYPLRPAAAILSALVCALALSACSADTQDATQITPTEATLHAVLGWESGEDLAYWFELRKRPTGGWFRATVHNPGVQDEAGNSEITERVAGLTPATEYEFRLCGYMTAPLQAGSSSNPICFDSTGNVGTSFDSFTTSSTAPGLRQVDGGTGYYGQFSNPLPTGAGYFPIGVWGSYNQTQANRDLDADVGINLYVWAADPGFLDEIRADSRFRAITEPGSPNVGSETVAWLLGDELDMTEGPSGCNTIKARKAALPDSRAAYANYGKGIFPGWETDAQFSCFVEAQELVSDDIYWFSDPNVCTSMSEGPSLFGLNRPLTQAECRRAANYGYIVDRMRALDARDGQRKPIWNFVEVSHPFNEAPPQSPNITDAQIRAAVWHSIIAGARGIIYFQHSFGLNQPCYGDHHTLRSNCHGHRAAVRDVNAQVKSLAPVLNAPFDDAYASASASVRAMAKLYNGTHYIFAGSRENVASTATFSVASGQTATVVGEGRSIPITNGRFTDSFANGNTIHIYRIG